MFIHSVALSLANTLTVFQSFYPACHLSAFSVLVHSSLTIAPVLPPLILIFSTLTIYVKLLTYFNTFRHKPSLSSYHDIVFCFYCSQAEVVTLAEQACEDIAGPFASMVSVLNISIYIISWNLSFHSTLNYYRLIVPYITLLKPLLISGPPNMNNHPVKLDLQKLHNVQKKRKAIYGRVSDTCKSGKQL